MNSKRYAENYKRIQDELLKAIDSTTEEEYDVSKGEEFDVLTTALRSACKLIARDHDCPKMLYGNNTLPAECWSMCGMCEHKATRKEEIERDTNCWVAFMYSCAVNDIEVEI